METLYKYSQFNITAKETDDKLLLYNTYSLHYRWLNKFDFDDIHNKKNISTGDVPIYLAEEGFIVPTSLDEIQRLKDDVKEHPKKADFMFLSIFTTLACNYRCSYCFEQAHLCQTEHMTKETADEMIAFIQRRYAEHSFTRPLKIKWFGGEPLLNMEIIRYISKELNNNHIKFSAKMYTNGRLLTKETALELKDLGVTDEVVIPIDGLAPTYAKLKGCTEDDFYKTIQNIKDCEDILKIILHINVSETSKNDVEALLHFIRSECQIKSYIQIVSIAPQNTDEIREDNHIAYDDFQKASGILQNRQTAIKRSFGCEARHPDYYVIGTKGELYICEHLIGQKEYMVGNIKDRSERIDRTDTIWDTDRIMDDCGSCPILPLCLGNCTAERYLDHIDCEREKRTKTVINKLLKLTTETEIKQPVTIAAKSLYNDV